ncbi:MAG: hypothetical protein WAU61_08760 [Smithella sp.]
MKRKLFLSILIIFFTTSFISLVGCNNHNIIKEQLSPSEKKIKEDDDLQKECGKKSEEYFKKEYGGGIINGEKEERLTSSYTNHYNKKFHTCFILINSTEFRNVYGKIESIRMKTFFDVNENRKYGSFIQFENDNKPSTCRILEKDYDSEKEWDLIVKPYMEE